MTKQQLNSLAIIFLSIVITYQTLESRKQNGMIEYYEQYTKFITDHYEHETDSLRRKIHNYEVATDTITWSVTTKNWTFDNNGMQYNGDSVIVVSLDSLQCLYRYYKLVIDSAVSSQTRLTTIWYGDNGGWKKRTVDGVVQYSLDGVNWFEL